jgi:hypothetical protein
MGLPEDIRTMQVLRKEYELKISELNNDRRELIMQNSLAQPELQKSDARGWELEKVVGDMQGEIRSLELGIMR